MKLLKLTLLVLGMAATLFAADPFAGTWKMNPAKTKYSVGTAPKEQTVTIMEMGSGLHTVVSGTAADGTKVSVNYTVSSSGGAGKLTEPPIYDSITSKRIGPTEREVSYLKGGKVVYTTHSKLSADGKTLTVHVKGLGPIGKEVEGEVVYDRQK